MQVEGGTMHSAELHKADLCKAPEAFDAVDMGRTANEFVAAMVDPVMLLVPQIDY